MSHHEYPSHKALAAGKAGSRFLVTAAVLFLVLLVVVGGLFLGRSDSGTEAEDAARAAVRTKNLAELQAADTTVLNGFDGGKMPIAKAMEAIVPILNAKTAGAAKQKQP